MREAQAVASQGKHLSVLGLFGKDMWRQTTAGMFAQLWQQLLGGNVMMYYIVYVFQMAGLTGDVNLVSSSIQYVIFLVTTGITLVFIEKTGRRNLFIYGGILCAALNFAVGGLMAAHGNPVEMEDSNINWVVHGPPASGIIACSYLFVAVYGFTWVCTLSIKNGKRNGICLLSFMGY